MKYKVIDNATNKDVTWTSSNSTVATVSEGTVSAISLGTTTITVTTKDGNKTASCTVNVIDPKDPNYPRSGDVYIAGSVGKVATIWKNGVAHSLTDGTNWASANSIYVSNGDVYVAGEESGNDVYAVGGDSFNVKLWKNGELQKLPKDKGEAYSVFVVK